MRNELATRRFDYGDDRAVSRGNTSSSDPGTSGGISIIRNVGRCLLPELERRGGTGSRPPISPSQIPARFTAAIEEIPPE